MTWYNNKNALLRDTIHQTSREESAVADSKRGLVDHIT